MTPDQTDPDELAMAVLATVRACEWDVVIDEHRSLWTVRRRPGVQQPPDAIRTAVAMYKEEIRAYLWERLQRVE